MKLNREFLAHVAGVSRFDDTAIGKLEVYADSLIAANQKINLISRSVEISKEIEHQVALSLILLRLFTSRPASWIDIGSGGGFPVVPMAIVLNATAFTAVEPVAKKAYFIERTAQQMLLANLSVEVARIEAVIAESTGRTWEVVSLKAVTDLNRSFRWASKLLAAKGKLITYKPINADKSAGGPSVANGFEQTETLNVKEFIDSIDLQVIVYRKS